MIYSVKLMSRVLIPKREKISSMSL